MRLDDLEKQATLLQQAKKHPPGTVAILCSDTGRYTNFWVCALSSMFNLPQGTSVKVFQGSDISELRNEACSQIDGEWLWFIDDDHGFTPDIVTRLLDREVDIVAPVCLRRTQPFLPVPTGLDGDFLRLNNYRPDELVEVMFAGSAGMIVRRGVLDAMEPPWFLYENGVSEDVGFCKKAVEAGFTVHVDMSVRLGHTTVATVWPVWDDEQERWMTGFTVADGAELKINAVEPSEFTA